MKDNRDAFSDLVLLRYQVYNSLFLTLGIDGVHRTGILLPLLSNACKDGLEQGMTPDEIVTSFFDKVPGYKNESDRTDQLFRFVQFTERQITLVDALEDAAYKRVHDLRGSGSFQAFYQTAANRNALDKLYTALEKFRVRIVLTAHPTQFYPGAVLGIITDLAEAVKTNNLRSIKMFLAQLGKTPFFKKEKPTPFDEAVSLTWYLENIFYDSIPEIYRDVAALIGPKADEIMKNNSLIQLGFWPGGDRDGNPYVTIDTTLKVADRLRISVFKAYHRDLRRLKRRITFSGVEKLITDLEIQLYKSAYEQPEKPAITKEGFMKKLDELREIIITDHNGLFLEELDNLRVKLKIFGFHFSTIDIRQDSRVIKKSFDLLRAFLPKGSRDADLDNDMDALFALKPLKTRPKLEDPILDDTFASFYAMDEIQRRNGVKGCYRYIISNCRGEIDVARVFGMGRLAGLGEGDHMYLDVIPLFETVDDLRHAGDVMEKLYSQPIYKEHIKRRYNKQVVMLGFSDGTKDGGYITANWGIFKAKEAITEVSRRHGLRVIFFDGRGGPPARGGGNTHKFYASLGPTIESGQIQLTIQGQTISSNFGTGDSSRHNMEQLLTAGLENQVLENPDKELSAKDREILEELSAFSYKTYSDFKAHPCFIPFLEKMSTLRYYGETNIGSRPSKRGGGSELKFEDLRAIPFVGAWSQLKQNVPGFYGVGAAFAKFDEAGRLDEIKELYKTSLFFRTLAENSMQSLSKSFFPLTRYMKDDPEFGEFWTMIYEESERARRYLLEVSGQRQLLETNPSIKASIALREEIVLPLLAIQQYGLINIKKLEAKGKGDSKEADVLRKLVMRSLYGNINASRNSA
ncbi:MAG: phosphoenolpyruvate carboxylase [Cryomorphaceae bacterium]